MTPLEKILMALPSAKRHGGSWSALCPAHDDHRPSLRVREGEDGRAIINCFAGCDWKDVVERLGLTPADLFVGESAKRSYKRRIAATYDYIDARGCLLFQVVRYDPRGFAQRRPDGASGWVWSMSGVPRVPFHLPQLIVGVADRRPVHVVEGEKDVLAAEAVGLVATCNPGGAGRWTAEYSEYLRGAQVVVVADRDEAGRKHARAVAASLEGVAEAVRTVEPAMGKDLAEHLALGGTPEELVAPIEAEHNGTSGRRLVVRALDGVVPETVEWLQEDRIPLGAITVLAGVGGVGKSTVTVRLASDLSRGLVAGALHGQKTASVFASAEDPDARVLVPRLGAAGADLALVKSVAVQQDGCECGITIPDDVDSLRRVLEETGARLLVIDPLAAALADDVDSHRDHPVRRALGPLARLAAELNVAVVVVVHFNKASSVDVVERIIGSVAITNAARSVFAVVPRIDEDSGEPRDREAVVVHAKFNWSSRQPTIGFRLDEVEIAGRVRTTALVWTGELEDVTAANVLGAARAVGRPPEKLDKAIAFLRSYLAAGARLKAHVEEAAADEEISKETLRRARRELGVLTDQGADANGRKQPSLWRLATGGSDVPPRILTPRTGRLTAQLGAAAAAPVGQNSEEARGFDHPVFEDLVEPFVTDHDETVQLLIDTFDAAIVETDP